MHKKKNKNSKTIAGRWEAKSIEFFKTITGSSGVLAKSQEEDPKNTKLKVIRTGIN